MRTTILLLISSCTFMQMHAQTLLKMENMNGRQVLPCKVNGISMKFTIDTGDDHATISLSDALFLLKNGHAKVEDLSGTEYDRFAYGHVNTGTTLLLRQLVIGNTQINNVKTTVSTDLRIPLVFGQQVMSRLERIEFDFTNQMITIKGGKNDLPQGNTASNVTQSNPIPVIKTSVIDQPQAVAETSTKASQKLLVKVNTSLYALPDKGPAIHPVFSNTFVQLIGEPSQTDNYLYVDYHGKKGYINRLALETK